MIAKRTVVAAVLLVVILAMVQPLLAQDVSGSLAAARTASTLDQLKSAAQQLDSASQSGGPTAAQNQKIETTQSQLASAAKQLDSATQSGGPTAAMNQKIQE